MKQRFFNVVLAVLTLLVSGICFAETRINVWQGGSGKWSDGDKWSQGAPQNGDVLVLTASPAGSVIENDIDGLSLSQIWAPAGNVITNLGKAVTITHKNGFVTGATTHFFNDIAFTQHQAFLVTNRTVLALHGNVTAMQGDTRYNLGVQNVAATEQSCLEFYGQTICADLTWSHSCPIKAYGPVDFYNSTIGHNNAFSVFLYAPSNHYKCVDVNLYGGLFVYCKDALPTNAVLTYGNKSLYNDSRQKNAVYELNCDQTIDRIESLPAINSKGVFCDMNRVCSTQKEKPVITMRGTADALSHAKWMDDLSFVWDPVGDYTLTFRDRPQLMTGTITVKGGTFRSDGTNHFTSVPAVYVRGGVFEVANTNTMCLQALQTLTISGNGVFRLAEGSLVAPFPGTARAVLRNNAKFELAQGTALALDELLVKGVAPPAGVYTGTGYGDAQQGVVEVAWIVGGGRLTVANANITSWKAPQDGDWSQSENWTHGVPTAGKKVYVTAEGSDYTVTISNPVWHAGDVTCGNADAFTVTLASSSAVVFTNATVTLEAGSCCRVSSGASLDVCGQLNVGDDEARSASLKNEGGTLFYRPLTKNELLLVKSNGILEQTAGTCTLEYVYPYSYTGVLVSPIKNSGGRVRILGGSFGSVPKGDTHNYRATLNLAGDVLFSNMTYTAEAAGTRFNQNAAGESGEVTFAPGTTIDSSLGGSFEVGNVGFTRLNINSQLRKNSSDSPSAWFAKWGFDGGSAEVNIRDNVLWIEAAGIHAGSMFDKADSSSKGVVNVLSNGTIVVIGYGAEKTGWSSTYLQGVFIGYATRYPAKQGDFPFYGEMNVYPGGNMKNWWGDFGVGVGYARGVLNIDGGKTWVCAYNSGHNAAKRTFGVGLLGGEGRCVITNGGSLTVYYCNGYLGGVDKSAFVQQNMLNSRGPGLAQGTLSLSEGSAWFPRSLVLGADGRGIVELLGSQGSFVAGCLVLSNLTDSVTSGGTLRYVADAQGVQCVKIDDALTIRENAKLEVDMRACPRAKPRQLLATFARRIGNDFAEVSINWPKYPRATLVWEANKLYLFANSGTVFFVR